MNTLVELFELLENNTKTHLTLEDIESIDLDSSPHLLKALYFCEDYTFLDSNGNPSLNESNITKTFGYKSSFYLSFIANKDSLNNEYLNARKALYKTMMKLREQREQEHKEEQNRISQLSYKEYKEEQREKERQARFSNRNTANKDSHLILESKDKNNVIIFLDSTNSLSNLIHIHNERIDIFTKDTSTIDIQELESFIANYKQRYTESNNQESKLTSDSLHSSDTQIFLYSQLLLGSKEIESNPLFFGELDKEGEFIESKPIYHLIDNGESVIVSEAKQSSNKGIGDSTLQIFLNGNTLTLLNYSLLDSSLNIKLECNSSESKEIQEREKEQREQQQQESKTQDSIQSTAMLHPILEDNEIKCPHNGVVKLKSNKGKSFTSKGIPLVLESDLLNAPIIGCANNIAGVPTPCSSVAVILPSSRGLKKFNDDYPIMQDLVASGCLTDKGFPLICTPKENTFRINSPNPTQANNQTKESLLSQIQLTKPILRLHYKIHSHQKDNLPIYRIKCNDRIIESHNDTPLDSLSIDIAKDTKELSDTNNLDTTLQNILSSLYASLKDTYTKGYKYHYLSLQLDSNALILILLIPQTIPKVFKEVYKNYEYKDYGIGKYHYLYNYCTHTMLDTKDYTQVGVESNPSNATILTLHTPYKAQRLELQLANGLDSILESKERQRQAKLARESKESKNSQQNKRHNTDITSHHIESQTIESKQKDSQHNTKQIIDSLLTLKIINGGYKDKLWSYGEEVEEEVEEKIDISQGILIASNDDAIAFELLATNPKHQFNCPDVESGSFIQNLRGFSGMLDFLENAIYNTKATLDYDNLKEYESYNTAEYKSNNIYAKNKCLSERIKAIYTKDWLSTLSKDTQEAYIGDIHIFMGQWRETLQENHQNIQSFVASFCKKVGCDSIAIDEQISNYAQFQFDIANTKIRVKRGAIPLNNQMLLINSYLLPSLRQWYIISHSQHNSFDVLLRNYMRYIEINIRYFYVYDESSGYFDKQPCRRDIHTLRQI